MHKEIEMLTVRKTEAKDLNRVMAIISQAQEYFKKNQIDQWQNGYPSIETIQEDMSFGSSYVLLENDVVIATAAIIFAGEPDYETIYEGEWLTHDKYGVIHRIAVDDDLKGSGIALKFMKLIEEMCLATGVSSLKIDTHRQNIPMQKYLKKNNFKYCGVIYLQDGSERLAFEKILDEGLKQ